MEKQEWLKARRIGSSDAIVIMGCAPRNWEANTPRKLWEMRLNEQQSVETAAMTKGKFFEEEATQWAENELGILLKRQEFVYHPEHEFMTATLDAVSFDGRVIVEIKVSQKVFMQVSAGKIPSEYYPQVQHQLEVMRAESAYLVGYVESKGEDPAYGAYIQIKRDDKYIAEMIKKEKEFWDCLQTFTPPALTNWDYQEREDALWDQAALELLMLDRELEMYEEIKKRRDAARNRLIELANGRNTRGSGLKVTQSMVKGRVNYESIPELKLVDLDQYREPTTERWTISKYGS